MPQARGCDAVQGSTYIRNVTSSAEQGLRQRTCHALLARFINAEFFVQVRGPLPRWLLQPQPQPQP